MKVRKGQRNKEKRREEGREGRKEREGRKSEGWEGGKKIGSTGTLVCQSGGRQDGYHVSLEPHLMGLKSYIISIWLWLVCVREREFVCF